MIFGLPTLKFLVFFGGEGVDGGWYPQEEVQEEQSFFTLILLSA
jgi:hypothetical protein